VTSERGLFQDSRSATFPRRLQEDVMRYGLMIGAALAAMTASTVQAGGPEELDREECLGLLTEAATARAEIERLVGDLDAHIFEAMIASLDDKVSVEHIPTDGLVGATKRTWDEVEAGLADLCRDKL
jgi:hypothetical protein